MWIWVCGPYASAGADAECRAANLRTLNSAALQVFKMGHIPIVGANLALPLIAAAGGDDASYDIRQPLSLALSDKCDSCLRLAGPSKGSDVEVARFHAAGKPVYTTLEDVPCP